MSYNLLLVLLYGQSQSMGEEFFVGAMSAIFFSIIIWLFNKRKQKKGIEETTKQVQQDIVKEAKENVCLASSIEIDYSFLYKDLLDKCNPSNYMNPYDAKKVEISNSIYSQIEENKNNTTELIKLRNRAIKELNIKFSSEVLFEKLTQVFNPSNFINENYDAVKLYAANKIYAQILDNRNDIIELERIALENKVNISSTCNEKKNDTIIDNNEQSTNSENNTIVSIMFAALLFLTIGLAIYYSKENSKKEISSIEQVEQNGNYFISQLSYDKFSITYPSTWEKVQQDVEAGTKTTISIQIMEKRKDDYSFSPNINIIVSKDKRIESTGYLAEISHKQLINANIDCELIGIYNCSLGGHSGSLLKQNLVLNGFKILQHQYIIKKEDNTTFIITAAMDYDKYKTQETIIDEILSSFIIK